MKSRHGFYRRLRPLWLAGLPCWLALSAPVPSPAAVVVQLKPRGASVQAENSLSSDLEFAVATGATFVGTTARGTAVLESATPVNELLSVASLEVNPLVAKATLAEPSFVRIKRLVVLFRPTPEGRTAFEAARSAQTFAGLAVVDSLPQFQGVVLEREAGFGAAELNPLKENANIRRIEPNYKYFMADTPDDPAYVSGKLWGMKNCRANLAWKTITKSIVPVAVIDTGVDYRHADLKDNMWINDKEIAGNGKDDDNNGYVDDVYGYDFAGKDSDPLDGHSHGTHCAGTVGGRGQNALGVVGVCWNVKIMAAEIFDASGTPADASDIAKAIRYSVDRGARVLSNSWGGGAFSQVTLDAIKYARDKGVLFIAAAGNQGNDIDADPNYPSGYDMENIICVGNLTEAEKVSGTSSYGKTTVDLFAPGDLIYSTMPGDKYGTKSGTSMATPHVAGACALIWSHPTYQTKTWQEIKDLVLKKVRPLAVLKDKCVTGGTLDLAFLAPNQPNADDTAAAPAPNSPGTVVVSVKESEQATGTVRAPAVGLGSETTGAVLLLKSGKSYQLDFGGAAKTKSMSEELKGKEIKVEGELSTLKSPDGGERRVLKVKKYEATK